MLIGISGKIGRGKDTVGNIIQYLTALKKYPDIQPSYEEFSKLSQKEIQDNPYLEGSISDWEIKKFADKLKDIVCLLIGCTKEQLEDREFKEKELGPEWWYWILSNGARIDFSHLNNGELEKQSTLVKPTPRLLLQIIGTECIRDKVHSNAWVNALFADYKADNLKYHHAYIKEGVNHGLQTLEYPNWIITDMRFPNELEAVKSKGGITIRVNRPYSTVAGDNGIPATFNHTQFHPSETALDDTEFDYTIENDSSIEDLIHTVSLILKREKII